MDRLTLRKASPYDSEFAYCVKRASFREYVKQVWGWDEEEQRRLHDERFRKQDFRVLNGAGTDVGILAIVRAPDGVKVNQLFLRPGYQGKGIGQECMRRVIKEARQKSLPVRLRVLKVNSRAQAFFRRLGFAPTGETETHVQMEKAP